MGDRGESVEIPTRLAAAWLERDGSEFEHIRVAIDSLEAQE